MGRCLRCLFAQQAYEERGFPQKDFARELAYDLLIKADHTFELQEDKTQKQTGEQSDCGREAMGNMTIDSTKRH